jgi:hypothetical protein
MAQIKLLKIDPTNGVPLEMDTAADDVTLNSFTVQGGGPVLSGTGLDLNGQAATDASSFQVTNPASGFLNQTAGNLIFDNIMAKERENAMTTAGGISFPVIANSAGEVDAFRLPALAGTPTATPTTGGEGHMVWDSTNNKLYVWDGSAWDDQTTAQSANSVDNSYIAEVAIAARDVVYLSSADNVSPALADNTSKSYALGFAVAAASATNPVDVRTDGILTGFSGLTAASRYYLDDTTAGAVTSTVPSGSGKTVVQVGYAKSATAMSIQILQLGRRA